MDWDNKTKEERLGKYPEVKWYWVVLLSVVWVGILLAMYASTI